jgi:glycosyltransferase involved in cell wall biosynthesis
LGLLKRAFWAFDPFLHITRRAARQVLCMNSAVAPRLGLRAGQFEIIPSVAIDMPEEMHAEARAPDQEFVVMIAARMVPLKGFDMVIQAFAAFYHGLHASDQPNARLLLIGSGAEQARLLQLVDQHGVAHCTQHLPWLDRAELLRTYRQASVFFFPSHEGAGMVVAEAMSYGVPVLCYRNEGPGELVPPASSLTVPYASFEQNVQDFAAQLGRLQACPPLLSAEAHLCRSHTAAHHTWTRRGQQLERIYQQALEREDNYLRAKPS